MKLSNSNVILVMSVVITLFLYFVPFGSLIAYPLILVSTMAHEFGHGIAALLVGGHFKAYYMWPDASGAALIQSPNGSLARAFIAAGGLIGPSIAAAVLFALAKYPKASRVVLYFIAALLVISEILVVRGWFGMFFTALFCAALIIIARYPKIMVSQFALVFMAVQLALSVFSRSDYLFTRSALTAQGIAPSDVLQMEQALFLPYWFWGLACGAFSILTVLIGLRFYIKNS